MVKPSPALCARLRFSTKQVAKGFYRGNRTGSMGAHTEYGGYVIDWRKVRNYAVPELEGFTLKPFVTVERNPKGEEAYRSNKKDQQKTQEDEPAEQEFDSSIPQTSLDRLQQQVMPFLKQWRQKNPVEFEAFLQEQWDKTPEAEREEITREYVSRRESLYQDFQDQGIRNSTR